MGGTSIAHARRQQGRLVVAAEFVAFAGIYLADWTHHIYLSKTLYLLVLAWLSLRLRNVPWRELGFALFRNWPTTLVLGIVAGACIEALELFCTQPFLAGLFYEMPDISAFGRVQGNVKWLAVSLALTWTVFAFGEELVFRGYLMNRIAGLFSSPRAGWGIALVLGSLVFGLAHFQQGPTGIAENCLDGMLLGALYRACGRRLAVRSWRME
jgi:membrane protease YdiL (CAAX protease family)